MRIGYPCINRSIDCRADRRFILRNFSEMRFMETVKNNMDCLLKILEFNMENDLFFFRISSDIIPFASHPVCDIEWDKIFETDLKRIGEIIRSNDIRISMHPDQFVVLNPLKKDILERSVMELEYQCKLLGSMGLDGTAKVQVHAGGIYGDKERSIRRLVKNITRLEEPILRRLVIENDDKSFSVGDCLDISEESGIPLVFDSFHHGLLNEDEEISEALAAAGDTWRNEDGMQMMDYSSQEPGERKGRHASTLDEEDFRELLQDISGLDPDIMMEIKDKERSAIRARKVLEEVLRDREG
jgi:UV DNA damage endonuclease